MTSDLDRRQPSTGDRARTRAYHRDFWPGMAGYVVVLVAALTWGNLDGDSGWRYVWAVLPVVPALWVVRALLRHIGRIDDYQRLLLLRGLAGGFAVAMVAALTVGLLGVAGMALPGAGWVVYGAGMLGWAVSSAVANRR
jgi:hypothetical protein